MRRRINPLIILLLALFPIIVPAADLPTLEKASNIREGYLDNGIKYYIASNKSLKGIVDMALVQKTGFIDETKKSRGAATVQARGSLTELQAFGFIFIPGCSLRLCCPLPSGICIPQPAS